jgi:hypothetical protein
MAGLDPAIHVFFPEKKKSKTWITATSPVMTLYLSSLYAPHFTAFATYCICKGHAIAASR